MPLKSIGKTIKKFRQAAHLSQERLAKSVKISTRHIQKIEAGSVDVNTSTIHTIAASLSLPPCYLLTPSECKNVRLLSCDIEILNLLPVGILCTESSGRLIYTNKTCRTIFNLSETDIQSGIDFWNLLPDESEQKKGRQFFATAKANEMASTPFRSH